MFYRNNEYFPWSDPEDVIFLAKEDAMVEQEKVANPPEKSGRLRLRIPHSSFPRKHRFKLECTTRNSSLLIALFAQ
jgi:hypothetical protein